MRWSGALALMLAAASGIGHAACSSAPTTEGDDAEEAAVRGPIAFGARSAAMLKELGQPTLVPQAKLAFDRAILLPNGGWHAVKLPGETLEITRAERGLGIKRTLPGGAVVQALTDARGVTADVEASYRMQRYQLPLAGAPGAASPVVGFVTAPSVAMEVAEKNVTMDVEYAQQQALLGVVTTTAGDRVLVSVAYLYRHELTPATIELGPSALRVAPAASQDEPIGYSFQYGLVAGGSQIVPVAQVWATFPHLYGDDISLKEERAPFVMTQTLNVEASTLPSPQVAQAASRFLAPYAKAPLGLYLDYVGAADVPRSPCTKGQCTRCPDAGAHN